MKTPRLLLLLVLSLLGTGEVWAQRLPRALSLAPRLAPASASALARPGTTALLRPRQQVRYTWDIATNTWVQPQRDVLTYTARAEPAEIISSDSATNVPYERNQYTYNPVGNLTELLTQTGNGTPWTNASRYVSSYDAQGLQTEELSQTWANTAWQTESGYRYQNTYSGAVLSEQVVQKFSQSGFVNEARFQYALANGRWSEVVAQRWDNGSWVNEERLVDLVWRNWEARQFASYRVQTWANGQWTDFQRTTTTYSPNGTTVTLVEAVQPGGGWQNFFRFTLPYDAQGNSLGYRQEDWQNNAWVLTTELRMVLRYDGANRLTRRTEQLYLTTSAQFINRQRVNYTDFQDIVTATRARLAPEQLRLYPCPAPAAAELELTGPLPDQTAAVEVCTLTGQRVWAGTGLVRQGQLRARLALGHLAAGTYLVRVSTGQGAAVRRFVHE